MRTSTPQFRKYIIFNLEKQRYGIPLALLDEIIKLPDITPVPNSEPFYRGLLNLRGQIISTVDLRLLLGLEEKPYIPRKTAVIISRVGALTIGAIVDEVVEVGSFDTNKIEDSTELVQMTIDENAHSDAQGHHNITILLNLEEILKGTQFEFHIPKSA